ncbi:cysteine synthase A [Bacillus sp. FJAT-27264]|uniref:cysteine synthase A n=1 Tax=Paenibacillus sp. (strain DSM 101736 / FJAT-27264) TaxID=1850362 RepID=UPI0008080E16|nr:cysteine synthase A [Bacillus sp. FJAT-27264]OBZ18025.1 cysteine synthase A [Bacillus sp. FJAT-27264]
MIYTSALEMIGKTPLLKLNNIICSEMADVYLKLEIQNPAGSIKDRAALGMIEAAEAEGILKPGDTIVEPTTGNTGIALSMIGRLKGYKVIIVMPETMSVERRNLIRAYGGALILTDGAKGVKGSIDKAMEMKAKEDRIFIPQQFINKANPDKHYFTTAEEIAADVKDMDLFVAGVGTGGTISGIGKRLKELNSKVKVVAVEPAKSPVLSGGQPGLHNIQGIGIGFVPDNFNRDVVDEILTVTEEEAFEAARLVAIKEGILIGISAGANVAISLKIAKKLGKGKKIVTVAPDSGEKYLSMGLYDLEEDKND